MSYIGEFSLSNCALTTSFTENRRLYSEESSKLLSSSVSTTISVTVDFYRVYNIVLLRCSSFVPPMLGFLTSMTLVSLACLSMCSPFNIKLDTLFLCPIVVLPCRISRRIVLTWVLLLRCALRSIELYSFLANRLFNCALVKSRSLIISVLLRLS